MVPAILGGSSLIQMLLGMLAWEAGMKGAKALGTKLVGKTAAELSETAAAKLGASAAGQAANKVLTPVAGAVGNKVGKYLSAEQIAKGAIVGGAGMGALTAGAVTSDAVHGLLASPSGLQYQNVVAAAPNVQIANQQQALAGMVERGRLEQALAQYIGSRDVARQFMQQDQGRLI